MDHHGRNHTSRGVLAALVAIVALSFGGTAYAGTSATVSRQGSGHVTAAQDQYGTHKVLTPPTAPSSNGTQGGPPAAPVTTNGSGTLPFTGLALLKVVLVGLGLLCLGFVLRRWSAQPGRDRR